eukprot:952250-Rhodomonas_salina.1
MKEPELCKAFAAYIQGCNTAHDDEVRARAEQRRVWDRADEDRQLSDALCCVSALRLKRGAWSG